MKIQKVRMTVAGLKTKEKAERTVKAHDNFLSACQNSHYALVELINFLNTKFKNDFLEPIASELRKSEQTNNTRHYLELLQNFEERLEQASKIKENTSGFNEEFKRAIVDFPPQKEGEDRKF